MQLRCRRNVNRITSQFLNIEREIRRDLVGGRTSTGELRAIQGKLADTYLVPYYIDHESTSAQTKQRKGNLRIFSFTYLAGDADLLRALRHLDWLRGAGLDSDSRGCWADDDDFDSCAAYFFFSGVRAGDGLQTDRTGRTLFPKNSRLVAGGRQATPILEGGVDTEPSSQAFGWMGLAVLRRLPITSRSSQSV